MESLQIKDVAAASALDKQWFGENGISQAELASYITERPHQSLALIESGELHGFATFEILENQMPKNYVGSSTPTSKTLFVHQFTTITNCRVGNMIDDEKLLKAIEEEAKKSSCTEIWVPLPPDHQYSQKQNPEFDTFGFYLSHGYSFDESQKLAWQPNDKISIICLLFKKKLHE